MELRKVIDKDKGPVVRFFADVMVRLAALLWDIAGDYCTKYEYVWDEEPFDYLTVGLDGPRESNNNVNENH